MASNALNAGIPEHIVQKMGNWKDRRMLGRYAHLADGNLRQAEASGSKKRTRKKPRARSRLSGGLVAEPTGLEPATSGVTVRWGESRSVLTFDPFEKVGKSVCHLSDNH